jgi:ATP-binding cassette subfamily B protein
LIATIGSGLAIWFGGNGIIANAITYGTLVAFISYMILFFEPVQELARIFAELQNAQASAERILSMLETEPEIRDSQDVIEATSEHVGALLKGENRGDSINPEKIRGEVEFRNVTFSYKDGAKVLEDFNLRVRRGEKIALVGETGSGKTTIVSLLCRFYEPVSGEIYIDGTDYTKRSLHWLQSRLGVVLQTPHLFNGTVADNIRYGNLEATMEEIVQASKMVMAHDFIVNLEKGYESQVGEGGNLLSTGQKQLISFARVILADPGLFILDEATSSVDTETEQLIQSAIDRLLRDRTSFIIAHRLSTIRSADRILVVEKGNIIESGAHHELINAGGYYYRLYTQQFIEQNEAEIFG